MRQFSIKYGNARHSLSEVDSMAFFENPSGLGIAFEMSMYSPKDGFFLSARKKTVQMPIVGTLVFKDHNEAYDIYQEMIPMLMQEEVSLFYKPYQAQSGISEYIRDVKLENISKGEKKGNWLYCPVSFLPMTPWYQEETQRLTKTETSLITIFSNQYAIKGDMGAAISLNADGAMPLAIQIGRALTADIYSQISIPASSIIANGTLSFSTDPRNSKALFTSAGTVYDMVERAELESYGSPIFGLMPQSESGTDYMLLNVIYDNTKTVPEEIKATLTEYWRSV